MMIPKKIHYCWFGRGEKPKQAQKCISSWKKYCPDYEIIEWNEDNFDISCNEYVKEAYEAKMYAFVSDYVRLYAMHKDGGIYMDTDVEVVRSLNVFLHEKAFSGFESKESIPTGIMAAEKGFHLFEYLLEYYDRRHFILPNGNLDTTTNTRIITELLSNKGFVPNGKYQVIDGFALYPQDFFCPLNNATGVLRKTKNTATIHWFSKSWVAPKYRIRSRVTRLCHRLLGEECFAWLRRQ